MTANTLTSRFPAQTWITATARLLAAAGTLAVLFSTAAFAADSTWLLGDDGKIAVSTFEHRTETGRGTEITLIYGEHYLKGSLVDKDAGKITLKEEAELPENRYVFTGTITIDYEKGRIVLKGKLTVQGDEIDSYNTTIKAKQMGE